MDTFGLPFVTNSSSAMDLCQHPEYNEMHGLFISPTSFSIFEGLVPIFSTGSPSTMGDILFPSPAYIESEFQYAAMHDIDWTRKRNNLYWAGSTTGGFASDNQWHSFHRQRFVKLAQNLDGRRHSFLRKIHHGSGRVESFFGTLDCLMLLLHGFSSVSEQPVRTNDLISSSDRGNTATEHFNPDSHSI